MFKRFLTKRFLTKQFLPKRFAWLLLWAYGGFLAMAVLPPSVSEWQVAKWVTQPAIAQPVLRTEDIAPRIYQLVPDLPLENQYVNKETRQVSQNNTLVSRLIRYHLYTKSRTPAYRLDWKLTLADYLGANERMAAAVYPGADVLQINPLEGDIAAIQRLTRAQRNAFAQALVTVFNPTAPAAVSPTPALPTAAPASPGRREPRPGDAQLLIP